MGSGGFSMLVAVPDDGCFLCEYGIGRGAGYKGRASRVLDQGVDVFIGSFSVV